nr:retrotransposon protein, putative, unclassified [Tanacetum cinerariifolium]
ASEETERVKVNCILENNLQQAATSGTQSDKTPIYDSDGSAEVHLFENCYDNDIFNMFTQEEQYTELLEPIPEPHQVPQNDSKVKSEISSVEQAKITLLLVIPDEHLLKFHGIKDAKTLWKAIKTRSEGLDRTYDRFQKLITQLEIHDLDTLSMDDLYNNLKVYEAKIKGQSSLSSNSQNVPFVSSYNTSSTNEAVNTAHDVSAASSQGQAFASTYADDVMFSFFANRSNSPQLDNEGLEQIVTDDLEEMDLKWQSYQAEKGPTDFTLMTFSSLGSSSSDTKVNTCSKECLKSYRTLQKQYDQEREILNKANLEIIAYQLRLESLESRIVVHQKNEAVFEEDIAFLKYDVRVGDNSITKLKNQFIESLKEKDDLKLKLKKFETSSKNLTNLTNSKLSSKDKIGLGYDSQLNERDLNKKSDVFKSASDSSVNESEEDNNQANNRYKAGEGYHAVPPLYTGNFMPSRPDLSFAGLADSVFKSTINKTITSVHETKTSTSKTSKETYEDVFNVPSELPPRKDHDHKIPLVEGAQPSLINEVFKEHLRKFVLVFFDEILMYSQTVEDHALHLKTMLEIMRHHRLYAKRSKYVFRTDKLKQAMISNPVLRLLDFSKEFTLETDASGMESGVVLLQEGQPIAFVSKTLSAKHQLMSTYEKEVLAIVYALEKWRGYLLDGHFKIKTGQFTLKYLLDQSMSTPTQLKLLPKLLGFDYKILLKHVQV